MLSVAVIPQAFFGMSERKSTKPFMKNNILIKYVELFREKSVFNIIIDTGESFYIYLYGGTKDET